MLFLCPMAGVNVWLFGLLERGSWFWWKGLFFEVLLEFGEQLILWLRLLDLGEVGCLGQEVGVLLWECVFVIENGSLLVLNDVNHFIGDHLPGEGRSRHDHEGEVWRGLTKLLHVILQRLSWEGIHNLITPNITLHPRLSIIIMN